MNKPNNLEPLWMPFTPNKVFKKDPRIIVGAKDMHFISDDNREILDGTAGLWCVNACLLYTSPSPRDKRQSRMPSSA